MARGEQAEKNLILTNQYALTYKDDTGDIINVSDDEDLHAAYDHAEESLGGKLKFEIKPRQGLSIPQPGPTDLQEMEKEVKEVKEVTKGIEEMQIDSSGYVQVTRPSTEMS